MPQLPKDTLTLFYLPHCPHCRLALKCLEELKAEDERYAAIPLTMIDEGTEKDFANQFDYYYVPTFYLGEDKLFEGHMEKADVKAVLDKALESIG